MSNANGHMWMCIGKKYGPAREWREGGLTVVCISVAQVFGYYFSIRSMLMSGSIIGLFLFSCVLFLKGAVGAEGRTREDVQ